MTTPDDKLAALMVEVQRFGTVEGKYGPGVFAAVRAAAIAYGRAVAIRQVARLEDDHECCTVGCGAVTVDGDFNGFCPTCILIQDRLTELRQEVTG